MKLIVQEAMYALALVVGFVPSSPAVPDSGCVGDVVTTVYDPSVLGYTPWWDIEWDNLNDCEGCTFDVSTTCTDPFGNVSGPTFSTVQLECDKTGRAGMTCGDGVVTWLFDCSDCQSL
jgi:hypothetical protein